MVNNGNNEEFAITITDYSLFHVHRGLPLFNDHVSEFAFRQGGARSAVTPSPLDGGHFSIYFFQSTDLFGLIK